MNMGETMRYAVGGWDVLGFLGVWPYGTLRGVCSIAAGARAMGSICLVPLTPVLPLLTTAAPPVTTALGNVSFPL